MKTKILFAFAALSLICNACKPNAEQIVPDSFFYAGESPVHRMYIVEKGQVTWEYVNKEGRGEISDAMLLDNGNILIAHQYGIAEINRDKQIVWSYEAPEGTEIHTVQPIGNDYILFMQNDRPQGKAIVIRKSDLSIVNQFEVPVSQPASVHGQFRCARLTDKGTYVVCNMSLGRVCEYDSEGNELISLEMPGAWGVEILDNGNWLVASNRCYVREYTPSGEIKWELNLKDKPEYGVTSGQKAYRLPNGNTIIGNWLNEWNRNEVEARDADPENAPVQFIAINPSGEKVWELRSWVNPNLGPSTTWQPLDKPVIPSKMHFGDFK